MDDVHEAGCNRAHTVRRGLRLALGAALAITSFSGCSTAKAPSGSWIDCGPALSPGDVTVLDIGRFGEDSAAVERHVREQVGAFRLFTPQPVGVPIRQKDLQPGGTGGQERATARAAEQGCDLLLVMHQDRITVGYSNPAASNQAGSYEKPVLVVLMGRRGE